MTNNDILIDIQYAFEYSASRLIEIFSEGDISVSEKQLKSWLKREGAEGFEEIPDPTFARFLNGWINSRRGKKEGPPPAVEDKLNNNIIFRKIKIALALRDDDIIAILLRADLRVSRHEISAFFRNPNKSQYRPCHDQILRNFLRGMRLKYRDIPYD